MKVLKIVNVKRVCKKDADEWNPYIIEERIHAAMKKGASSITQQLNPEDRRYSYCRKLLEALGFKLNEVFKNPNGIPAKLEEWKWVRVKKGDGAFTWKDVSTRYNPEYIAFSKIFSKMQYVAGTWDNHHANIELRISPKSSYGFDIPSLKKIAAGDDLWDKDLIKVLGEDETKKFKRAIPALLKEMKEAQKEARQMMIKSGDIVS